MKKKKLLLSLIFIVTFLTFNSKVFAFLPPHLAIKSKNYSVNDKIDYEEDATIEIGDTLQLYAIIQHGNEMCLEDIQCGLFADETNLDGVIWTSSNTEVATVDNVGKVTANATGQTTITAKYNDKTATYEINVKPKDISIGSNIKFIIDDPGPSMILNFEEKFSVGLIEITSTEKENIKFKIENEDIAKIIKTDYDNTLGDVTVTIKYLSVGKTKLIATLEYNGETYTDSYDLDVKEFDGFLYISAQGYTDLPTSIKVGDKIQLNAELYNYTNYTIPLKFDTAHDLEWTSSNENIATVNNGLINAKSEGEVTINVKYTITEGFLSGKSFTETYTINIDKDKTGTPVDDNNNIIINPKTGTIFIIFAWIVGISSLGYAFWHFKKI